MKKILLFICAVGISLTGFTQQSELTIRKDGVTKVPSYQDVKGQKVDEPEWYNYTNALNDISIGNNFFTVLFPDTLVKMEYSNGMAPVNFHSMGQVFDPKSSYWIGKTNKHDSNDAYTVDSIAIPYKYYRYQNGVPDTLLIHVSKHDKLMSGSLTSSGNVFKTTPYDYLNYRGTNFTQEFVEILDYNDTITATGFIRFITKGINVDVNPGEVLAVSWTYLPGNPYNEGDTIFAQGGASTIGTKINRFDQFYNSDDALTYEFGIFNAGMVVPDVVRYNMGTSWDGIYISGIAYNSYINVNSNFYLPNLPTGIEDVNELGFAVNQNYPNPFSGITNIEYALSSSSNVVIEIFDITGKTVMTINEGLKNVGEHKVTMDASNMKSGVYYYTFRTDEGQVTKKMLIQR